MMLLPIVIGLVALERLGELAYAAHNTRNLKRRGGIELGGGHYYLLVALHAAWLAALLILLPWNAPVRWFWLGIMLILQGLRIWTLASLGRYWTTRIVTVPQAPLVRRGPYRYVRHPNYLVVIGEIAVLPLAFGAWRIALVFSALNLALLAWRIRIEARALAPRRSLPPSPAG
jgi:methyltransferase